MGTPLGDVQMNGRLTERERDVLSEMAKGSTMKEICSELGISVGTCKSHIASIFLKFDVHNRVQALRAAREHNYQEAS